MTHDSRASIAFLSNAGQKGKATNEVRGSHTATNKKI